MQIETIKITSFGHPKNNLKERKILESESNYQRTYFLAKINNDNVTFICSLSIMITIRYFNRDYHAIIRFKYKSYMIR